MTRQVRRAAARRVERAVLGGLDRSEVGADVAGFVDALADVAYRLGARGWSEVSSGSDLAWDWTGTGLPEARWDEGVMPCTSLAVSPDDGRLAVNVTLVGQPDVPDADFWVAPENLTDDVLTQLEVYTAGAPVPAFPTTTSPG